MRQAVPKKPKTSTVILSVFSKTVGVVLFAATAIVALAMAVSLYSYHPADPAWSSATAERETIHNLAGEKGAYFADIILSAIGSTAWLLPILLLGFGYQLFFKRKLLTISLDQISFRLLGVLIAIFSLAALLDLHSGNGGMMGGFIGTELIHLINNTLAIDTQTLLYITKIGFAILTFIGFYLITGMGPIGWADRLGSLIFTVINLIFPKKKDEPQTKQQYMPDHDGNIDQNAIDRMLDQNEQKSPSFFNKIFSSKQSELNCHQQDFIEIDESLLKEDEYQTNAPIQDPLFNSYNYHPLEEEKIELEEDVMNNNNNIPPIFRNLQKTATENQDEQSSQAKAPEDFKIDPLAPQMDEWDQFIRAPQTPAQEEISHIESEEDPSEKKGIPSIFKNLFKARKKKHVSIAEGSKVEPSLTAMTTNDTSEEESATLTESKPLINAYQPEQAPEIVEDPVPSILINDEPITPSSLQFSISDSFDEPEDEVELSFPKEIAPQAEEVSPHIQKNTDISPESTSETLQTNASKPEFIGHEIDPRSGMPIAVKAPKEYPMAGRLPGLDLLGNPPPVTESYDALELQELASLIEDQFKNFNIEVKVVNIEPGPVITRFELDLAAGVKIAQINNLNKDIARALSVTSVRIVDIIPGKPYIGLEIPNKKRQIVYFKEGLYADAYRNSKHPLTILLGKDVSGQQVVANLMKMPHLLIAGTTGSGKSVGLNTILLSLLYKAHPDDLRLILIDPKMLELSVYDNIPHLLAPVVTDMKESANALRWAVVEMERRYLLMSKLRVRNIDGFNQKVKEAISSGTPLKDPLWDASREVSDHVSAPDLKPLPYIVIVIDELADMMMSVGKAVEELIARLTQKARAAGIHMVVATQRPSVDVITGLIKANIPSRIAFQVSSKIDSRTVLDQQGAENLLGHGDMLYFPTGAPFPLRVHGAFVDDNEVNRVADFLRLTGPTDYIDDILKDPTEEIPGLSENASGFVASPDDVDDPLYDEAVKIVLEDKRPTISYVQRKLRIGYQRAARLIEAMEEQGIVSAPAGNGNREILVSYD
ncbi:DNA translocase FtsK 4TM domain-containing protein [Ignatzschineria rhizosphaerae]|uniref:DNA translocase FtsK n=1 Tax=Ignatzschineria rhizosphaerae TaxID=2923279 RepID=A0ABY3X141_9GAMM|nr:DNA translocase FtsK [Ignatzschineria rhizosphaerae]UNM96594.1 DNA translocase FtsK 4TM domain-containing protein [Ignatzschineria rhizosphaerae]